MRLPAAFLQLAERALNEALTGSLRARELGARLAGKSCTVALRDLDAAFHLLPEDGRVRLTDTLEQPADVVISGTLPALVRANFAHEGLPEGVRIQGDAALAQRFQQLLAEADFDWEEQLSRWVGDLPARRLGGVVRGMAAWGRQAFAALETTTVEYLREEAELLPRRHEVARFLGAVDALRDDVERFEARLRKLERGT